MTERKAPARLIEERIGERGDWRGAPTWSRDCIICIGDVPGGGDARLTPAKR